MRHPKANRYSEGQGRLAGREQVVWAGKGKLAGRKADGSESGVMQEGTYLISCNCMACVVPYKPYIQPLDAQFGVGFTKFSLFLQGIQGAATQLFFCFLSFSYYSST